MKCAESIANIFIRSKTGGGGKQQQAPFPLHTDCSFRSLFTEQTSPQHSPTFDNPISPFLSSHRIILNLCEYPGSQTRGEAHSEAPGNGFSHLCQLASWQRLFSSHLCAAVSACRLPPFVKYLRYCLSLFYIFSQVFIFLYSCLYQGPWTPTSTSSPHLLPNRPLIT